jgi:transcriptional regulator with XRE-family HTH domain
MNIKTFDQRRADFRDGLIERVRLAREQSGKTPRQMADELGISVKRYRGWETRSEIRHWFLGPFADATGVSVRWLLTEHRPAHRAAPLQAVRRVAESGGASH